MPHELLPHSDTPVFLRKDALAAGYHDRDIERHVRSGEWVRIRRGAYVLSEVWAPLDAAGRHALVARAVLRTARTKVVLSHVSALPEYDAPIWSMPLEAVHLTRLDRHAGRNEAGVQQHQGRLLPDDIVVRNGVPVTSATRLAIDITTVAPVEPALCVINHLLHAEHTNLDAVRDRYRSMEGDPYTLRTDLTLRLADPRIESVLESRGLYMFWRQGIPAPEPQFEVTDGHGLVAARLDFAWPERRVWVEFDGREKYVKFLRPGETISDAVLREKRREDMIRELTGWRCIRITWADLEDPLRLAARLRTLLRVASEAS
jgi:hypothetical protein